MDITAAEYAILQGAELYDWQYRALTAVSKGWPTSIVTCNGAGKTSEIAARAVDWFFKKHPRGWLVATSGSFNQLQNQLWPALETKLPSDFSVINGTSPCKIRTPQGGQGIGFATNDAKRAEGWHPKINKETDPVFILVDESKAVPDDIFVAFDRCTVSYCLYISSPGQPNGRFYDTHHKVKKYYYTMQVGSHMCPHIDPDKRERDKDVLGEDSPEYRSMHLAEFTDLENSVIITQTEVAEAIANRPTANREGEKVAFFDFAAGGDENTFYLREGNVVRCVANWRDSNTVQAVRKFIRLAKENGLQAGDCWGDADGLGLPMVRQFWDEGFYINEFRGGLPAKDPQKYKNMISEAWIQGARQIKRGMIHLENLPVIAIEQMTNRLLQYDNQGKLKVETKEDMKKRGVSSPDHGDGVFGCIMCGARLSGGFTKEAIENTETGTSDFHDGHVQF